MRNTLAIGIFLVALGLVLALSWNHKPVDPLALNPPETQVSSNLINPDGNVLWISVEGMRPDHMATYGYENVTTPRIDSLASESLVFERCYAQSTETYRSIVTMLTSQYPNVYPGDLGANSGRGFRDLLGNPRTSLVARIRESGHTTAAIVGNPMLDSDFGFGEGFDYYDDKPATEDDGSIRERSTGETYKVAETWLSRNFRRPFFMFVDIPDPQGPHDPDTNSLRQLHILPSYLDQRTLAVSGNDLRPINALPSYFGKAGDSHAIGDLMRLYDGEIAEADYYTGELMDLVSRLGIDDKTMIIVSGSHGEALGEHGYYFSNGGSTFHCLSSIPLIIHNPRGHAGRIKDVVEGIDIMPTAMSYLDIERPKDMDGISLLPFYKAPSRKREYPAFCYWDSPVMVSAIKGDYELINFENKEYKLFHVINDPAEIHDIYSESDPVAQDLTRLMELWTRQNHGKALENETTRKSSPDTHKPPMIIPPGDVIKSPK